MCGAAQIVRVTDVPAEAAKRTEYLRARVYECEVHLKVADAMMLALAEELSFIMQRFSTIERLNLRAAGMVLAATAVTDTRESDDDTDADTDGEQRPPVPAAPARRRDSITSFLTPMQLQTVAHHDTVVDVSNAGDDPATAANADELWLQVVEAVHLPVLDIISETSDPLAHVCIEGDAALFATKYASRCIDPVWGSEFEFRLRDRLREAPPCVLKV